MRMIFGFVLACVSFGLAGAEGAEARAPRLLVLNKLDDSLAIVDPATLRVVDRVRTGHVPHEVAASTDGTLAFTGNYGTVEDPGHSLSVVDVSAAKELRRVELGPMLRPHGLAFAEGKLYFTAEESKLIGRYDPASDRVDWVLGTGQDKTHMVALSRDAKTIFTANILSNSIGVIERTGDGKSWAQTLIPVGLGPEGFDLMPDGKELWAATSKDGRVSVVDLGARRVSRTVEVQTKRSNRLKITPDGKTVLVSDMGAGDLVVLDAASRSVTKRLHLGKAVEGILILDDGSKAYVAVTDDNVVAVVDLKTFDVTGRVETGAGPDGMAWVGGR